MRGVLHGIDLSGLSDGGAGVGYPVTADVLTLLAIQHPLPRVQLP